MPLEELTFEERVQRAQQWLRAVELRVWELESHNFEHRAIEADRVWRARQSEQSGEAPTPPLISGLSAPGRCLLRYLLRRRRHR